MTKTIKEILEEKDNVVMCYVFDEEANNIWTGIYGKLMKSALKEEIACEYHEIGNAVYIYLGDGETKCDECGAVIDCECMTCHECYPEATCETCGLCHSDHWEAMHCWSMANDPDYDPRDI